MAAREGGRTLTSQGHRGKSLGRKRREQKMRKLWQVGGFIAAAVLIAFGAVSIAISVDGRSTVRDSLKAEQIVGTPDMTKAAIAAEAKQAGLPATISLPTANIAGKA